MDVRRRRRLLAIVVFLAFAAGVYQVSRRFSGRSHGAASANGVFLVAPYVQLGDAPQTSKQESLDVLWQAADRDADWSVAGRNSNEGSWTKFSPPSWRRYTMDGLGSRRIYRATLKGLPPNSEVAYRVLREGESVFEARARTRKARGKPHRFVAFGDGGADTGPQKAIAYHAARSHPDFVLITGDLVYYKGRLSEYLDNFFPIYNSDDESLSSAAPLMRSTPFLVAPGNHDLLEHDLGAFPDALAYFFVWSLPLNGPLTAAGAANTPTLRGPEARRKAFRDLVGDAYPRTANYAFDYGDVHWTILDGNPYVNWTDPTLRAWLERDLAAAQDAPWRFVSFHQAPFHSTKAHAEEQWMRLLTDLFEKYHVNIVFNGHVHNYQRTYPLHFVAEKFPDGRSVDTEGRVNGRWTLDKRFDGRTQTVPDGIIYVVTGAGGARLYGSGHRDDAYRQPFTAKLASDVHSFTIVDVDAAKVQVLQVSSENEEIDRFVVTR